VFCESDIRPFFRGSPDLNLHAQTATVEGMAGSVYLEKGKTSRGRTKPLKMVIESYTEKFEPAPKTLAAGWPRKTCAFPTGISNTRAKNPGCRTRKSRVGGQEISFGKQRIPFGYEPFRVQHCGKSERSSLPDGTRRPCRPRCDRGRQNSV